MSAGFSGQWEATDPEWEGRMWGKPTWEFTNSPTDPLTCELQGTLYRPDNHFRTDYGSVPRLAQVLMPMWFDRARFTRSYIFHDSSYAHGGVWVGITGGWKFHKLTRKQADQLLRDMVRLEGGSRGAASAIYWGVRVGGRWSWKGDA